MASVPELDLRRITKYCDERVPARLRNQARVEARLRGPSITIFDCRPPWHASDPEWSRAPIAQLRYDHERRDWTLYWADRNGRWHRYDLIEPGTAEQLLAEIEADPTCIFWG